MLYNNSEDVKQEKPHEAVYTRAFEQARFWCKINGQDLERDMVLHIGDSLPAGIEALYYHTVFALYYNIFLLSI
jgi:FMN phosphatase YigB (HAD superfamily)